MPDSNVLPKVLSYLSITLSLALIGWSCSGCSPAQPPRQAVRGTLTLDGKPISGVVLVFAPTGADQVGATTVVTAGQFSLGRASGPSEGRHFVTLDVIEPDLEQYIELRQAGKRPLSSLRLPPRYSKLGTLHADVRVDGDNVFNFELTSR